MLAKNKDHVFGGERMEKKKSPPRHFLYKKTFYYDLKVKKNSQRSHIQIHSILTLLLQPHRMK